MRGIVMQICRRLSSDIRRKPISEINELPPILRQIIGCRRNHVTIERGTDLKGASARMQYCDLRVNHSFSDFEDQAGRIGVLYGNEVCSESARHGAAKQSLQLCVCGWKSFETS